MHCVFIFAGISIHALLAESDKKSFRSLDTGQIFLSTLSLRRATTGCAEGRGRCSISIHALLAESDHTHVGQPCTSRHFYPRSPCGERLAALHVAGQLHNISIHALLAESDLLKALPLPRWHPFLSTLSLRRATAPQMAYRLYNKYFYPRSPCGERPNWFDLWGWAEYFYPRSPCGERPRRASRQQPAGEISIHALLAESDKHTEQNYKKRTKFLSTLSLRRATSDR